MKHELKCWPEHFQATWVGDKTFEIRRNDRNFKERDEVELQEYDPNDSDFTGRSITGFITYLTNFAQSKYFVVFSIREIGRSE